jgi:hypothetical protein
MAPAGVIEPFDVVTNGLLSLVACGEPRAPDEFLFDGLEYAFDHRVVVAIPTPTHRGDEICRTQHVSIIRRAVLAAAIGVMNQPGTRFSYGYGARQGIHRQASFHSIAHTPANYFTRE